MSLSGVSFSSLLLCPTATEEEQREESDTSEAQQKWSELPKDLVVTIGERLDVETDYVQFRSTCKSWYSFLSKKPYHPTPHFPVLISRRTQKGYGCRYGIFGLSNNKLYHLRDLPDHFQNGVLLGSSHGWLIIALYNTESPYKTYIYNPFTKAQLDLPPTSNYQLQKVILSSTPPAQFSHLLVAISSFHTDRKLVYCRPGDTEWTDFGPKRDNYYFEDVLFHGNKIYAVQWIYRVYVFHMDVEMQINSSWSILQPQLELIDEIISPYLDPYKSSKYFRQQYLVESSDDLLVVVRVLERKTVESIFWGITNSECHHNTICFFVFKWEGERWLHVKSIGDQSLFVGLVSSFSISSRDFPDCKGNCIYFTDGRALYRDYTKRDYDRGVFSLEDECVVSSLPLQVCAGSGDPWKLLFRRPPAWLTSVH